VLLENIWTHIKRAIALSEVQGYVYAAKNRIADLSEIHFENPMLPPAILWISIKNLRMGEATIDCTLRRHPRDVGMNVDRKEGNVKIVLVS